MNYLLPHIYRRLLIYQNSLDQVIGIIHIGDIFKASEQERGEFTIRALMQPVGIVPQDVKTDTLLEELRFTQQHLAVVVDNYGATAGIVTLADQLRQDSLCDLQIADNLDGFGRQRGVEVVGIGLRQRGECLTQDRDYYG